VIYLPSYLQKIIAPYKINFTWKKMQISNHVFYKLYKTVYKNNLIFSFSCVPQF